MKKIILAAVLVAFLLSSCSFHSLGMSPEPPERPRVDKATVVEKKPAELDTGATEHKITAQGKTLVINYSTEQNPKTWTKETRSNIMMYASMPGVSKKTITKIVYVQVAYKDGTSILDDTGEFIITPPYTYGTILAAWPDTLYVTFDVLMETEPDSGEFFKQRFVDELRLTPAEGGSK